MENNLEQLLDSLIEKGWKPRGEEEIKSCQIGESFYKRKFIEDTVGFYTDDRGTPQWLFTKSLREVCSKSSGLWQFVCENKLENPKERKQWTDLDEDGREYVKYSTKFYEYRLIEASLKDESELEDFLLSNIIIKDEKNIIKD